jgi:hypothetical protein
MYVMKVLRFLWLRLFGLCVGTPQNLEGTYVSEEHSAPIFRVEVCKLKNWFVYRKVAWKIGSMGGGQDIQCCAGQKDLKNSSFIRTHIDKYSCICATLTLCMQRCDQIGWQW